MQQPFVTVVIPTYNRLPLLKEAVASVQQQTFKNWELIIIDDCSPDETWLWLSNLNSAQIKVLRQTQNSGPSAARNWGIREAKGEFIIFLDDDDLLFPDALENLTRPLLRDPTLIAVMGARLTTKKNKPVGMRNDHPKRFIKRSILPEALAGFSLCQGQILYRTITVRETDGFPLDQRFAEDRVFWLRFAQLGAIAFIPEMVFKYQNNPEVRKPNNAAELREEIFQEFIETLSPAMQRRGQAIRKSARTSGTAETAYRKGNYGVAFKHYLKACYFAPRLVISPILGPNLIRGVMKSFIRLFWPAKRFKASSR